MGQAKSNMWKIKLHISLFDLGFTIWFVSNFIYRLTLLNTYISSTVFNGFRYLALLIILTDIFLTIKFSIKTWMGLFYILLSVIIGFNSGTTYLADIAIIMFAARNYDLKNLFRKHLYLTSFLAVMTIALSYAGVIDNRVFYRVGDRPRYSLGFSYTTFLSQLIFFATMTYVYLKDNQLKFYQYLLLMLFNISSYYITNTRNPLLMSFIFLVIMLLMYYFPIFHRLVKKMLPLSRFIFIATSGIAYYFSLNYNKSSLSLILDTLLSSRLSLSKKAFDYWGITWLGQKVEMYGGASFHYGNISMFQQYNYIDSSYIQLIIIQGQIYFAVIILLFTLLLYKLHKLKNYNLMIMLTLLSIHSIIDPQLLLLWYSPLVLTLGLLFRDRPIDVTE